MTEEINGIYDDDGNKINPDLIPKPSLCIFCRKDGITPYSDTSRLWIPCVWTIVKMAGWIAIIPYTLPTSVIVLI